MLEAVSFAVLIVGLIRPDWVRNRKAFGVAVIFVVLNAIALTIGIGTSAMWAAALRHYMVTGGDNYPLDAHWMLYLALLSPLLKIGLIIALIKAYWPGGELFNVGGECAEAPSVSGDESAKSDSETE